jgi:hypothetical protein
MIEMLLKYLEDPTTAAAVAGFIGGLVNKLFRMAIGKLKEKVAPKAP